MLVSLILGWKFPVLGYVVPVSMAAGIAGGLMRGRYVCGNFCPRGSFLDTFFRPFGGSRPIPPILFSAPLRWTLMALLMGFMVVRLAQDPGNPMHWGEVFWSMCLITSLAAFVLGALYHPRSWCALCPVGTMASALGKGKYQLEIAASCSACDRCSQSCPFGLPISQHREAGALPHADCLKCSACVGSCPKGALSFPAASR
jgi:polyferredoxin